MITLAGNEENIFLMLYWFHKKRNNFSENIIQSYQTTENS